MAAVAGVSAAELQAAGREDAAGLLERHAARGTDTELLERIRAMDSEQARELLVQIAAQLGITVAGGGSRRGRAPVRDVKPCGPASAS